LRRQRSPSSFNLQPTQIVIVQDAETKNRLSEHAMLGSGNQYRTKDASLLAVFLSDLEVTKRINRINDLEHAAGMRDPNYMLTLPIVTSLVAGEGHAATWIKQTATRILSEIQQPMPSIEPVQAWTYKSTSLAAQTYVLSATSHGLATCIMEGFDNRRLKEVLRIPDRYDVPLTVATGHDYYDNDAAKQTPRLGLEEVCFRDTFGQRLVLNDLDDDEGMTESS
jgi:nitroreductase